MKKDEINKIINDFDLEQLELSSDNLTEIELADVKNNVKKKIKKNNKKGILIVASVALVIIGGMVTPAVSKNLPFINDIYKELGFFNEYEEYTKYIGETKESNGYKVTIDSIVGTQNKIEFAFKITSPIKMTKEDEATINAYIGLDSLGSDSSSGGSSIKVIDEYNFIYRTYSEVTKPTIPKKGDFNIVVSKYEPNSLESQMNVNFNLKLDFTSSFDETEKIKVNKDLSEMTRIDELISTVSDVYIIGDYKKEHDYMNNNRAYILNVDGVLHYSYGPFVGNKDYKVTFDTVNSKDIKEAESIEVIEIAVSKIGDIELDARESSYKSAINDRYENIEYQKEIISNNGQKGEVYKIEKEETSIKFYFKSEFEPLTLLIGAELYENVDGVENIKRYNSSLGYDEEGYFVEFKDVNTEGNLNFSLGGYLGNIDNGKISGKLKIK